ncbi:MAG: lipoyl(octanoyl) transferase LipB [Holosporales bacterium]|nr:lipoyl(octanoyl) transferase LipB [Holosporales bacterium]
MKINFINQGIIKYPIAMLDMEIACAKVIKELNECVFIVEHNPLYSAGRSFKKEDFLKDPKFPVYFPKRGGRVTVHSPGQLVVYPVINLRKRNIDISSYIKILENWMINALKELGINPERSDSNVGVWLNGEKIGFIGISVERGIASHGFCVNISNDLSMFDAIVPCGINGVKITSLEKMLDRKFDISSITNVFIKTAPF